MLSEQETEQQPEKPFHVAACGAQDFTVPPFETWTPLQQRWTRCRRFIEAALPYALDTHSIEDIEQGIAEGRFQFWPGQRSAIITELITYPRKRALNYFLLGGDLEELKEMEPSISAWAYAAGCTHVIGVGRRGFERVFADAGFKPAWSLVVKELVG